MNTPKPATGGRSALGWILLTALLAVSVVAFFEFSSRSKATAAYEKVDAALAAGESIDAAQVREWMAIEPTHVTEPDSAKTFTESYEFSGVVRKRTIDVTYTKAASSLVDEVSIR